MEDPGKKCETEVRRRLTDEELVSAIVGMGSAVDVRTISRMVLALIFEESG
jgi:hypothetical protein